jgi:membrane protease YdiL (CAAX protease family)
MATRVIGPALLETGETEAAWAVGSTQFLLSGLIGGIAVAALSTGWQLLLPPSPDAAGIWFIHRLITAPGWSIVFFWPTLVLIGPALEELLFRGVLLGALSQKTGKAIATMIVTLLFVATHFQVFVSYVPALVPLTLVGVILAVLRFRAHAVGPAIVLHATYNTIVGLVAVLIT